VENIIVKLKDKEYPIVIKRGLIDSAGIEIKKVYSGERIVVITDKNVDRHYGDKFVSSLEAAGYRTEKIVVPPGEQSKSIGTLTCVYASLAEKGITRGDLIVALGGGVVGDLGGFAAATYLRGVHYVQVPTTLLAQIDSSIGGKVAIDLEQGKNLVGCFYHPDAVLIDPNLPETLDRHFLHDGTAEAIKYGCIMDRELFDRLSNYRDDDELLQNLEYIIKTCCTIKRDVVQRDERDVDERMILNFGHTIGHAIEKYFDYKKYTHGEAVAAGMYIMTVNSERLGLTEAGTSEKIRETLKKYSLPWSADIKDHGMILDSVRLDKKNIEGGMNIIILKEIGNCEIYRCSLEFINENIKL
jgi:3-dehydroquinate synthase